MASHSDAWDGCHQDTRPGEDGMIQQDMEATVLGAFSCHVPCFRT
jgi:hypothetical protein